MSELTALKAGKKKIQENKEALIALSNLYSNQIGSDLEIFPDYYWGTNDKLKYIDCITIISNLSKIGNELKEACFSLKILERKSKEITNTNSWHKDDELNHDEIIRFLHKTNAFQRAGITEQESYPEYFNQEPSEQNQLMVSHQPELPKQSQTNTNEQSNSVVDKLLDLVSKESSSLLTADDFVQYVYLVYRAASSKLPENEANTTIKMIAAYAGKAKVDYGEFVHYIKRLPCYANSCITDKDLSVAYAMEPKIEEKMQEIGTNVASIIDELLSKYDIKAVDSSIIKYYQAIQQWTDDIMNLLDKYEKEKESVIHDFNSITLQLSKKYEKSPNLTEEENELLEKRQKYFQKRFSIGMDSVKSKILSVKKQADNLEYQINEINEGDNSIQELALIEKEDRASFSFITENTIKMIEDVISKTEYFEHNRGFILEAVQIWSDWSEDYRVFKTTYREDLKNICEEDGIEEEIWTEWYESWRSVRFAIEQKVQPLIEYGLKADIPTENQGEETVIEQMISILAEYKNKIDKFFIEERKGIYQKFAFQAGGELQDKFETESGLYKQTSQFQTALQEVIFSCSRAEDRVFILNWANSLLDIQVDEILTFVEDNDLQQISKSMLEEFAALKQKNYDTYLSDVKAYSEEKANREKQYNSLMFKMRKDLMK